MESRKVEIRDAYLHFLTFPCWGLSDPTVKEKLDVDVPYKSLQEKTHSLPIHQPGP